VVVWGVWYVYVFGWFGGLGAFQVTGGLVWWFGGFGGGVLAGFVGYPEVWVVGGGVEGVLGDV
jgi:hypothetical protein